MKNLIRLAAFYSKDETNLELVALSQDDGARFLVANNRSTSSTCLRKLLYDPNRSVRKRARETFDYR